MTLICNLKRIMMSKKTTIVLVIISLIIGASLYFIISKNKCFEIYTPTYTPYGDNFFKIDEQDLTRSCEERAARFADELGEEREWVIEERNATEGTKTYQFDTSHMQFRGGNGKKYTFVTDQNGRQALLGFIDNTFIFINNTQRGAKLSQDEMIKLFHSLQK